MINNEDDKKMSVYFNMKEFTDNMPFQIRNSNFDSFEEELSYNQKNFKGTLPLFIDACNSIVNYGEFGIYFKDGGYIRLEDLKQYPK